MSRFQLFLVFVSLLLLRVVVGFHFFKEGTTKLKSGFDPKPFFVSATGPLAPYFKSLIDDPDGQIKLCLRSAFPTGYPPASSDRPEIDPQFTFDLWDDFIDQATAYYGLGSPELIAEIEQRVIADKLKLISEPDNSELRQNHANDLESLKKLSNQPQRAQDILIAHQDLLADFLDANRTSLVSYFGTADRVDGFLKDGSSRSAVALNVDSLRGQVDTIESDRKKQLTEWSNEVTSIWDSLELQVNDLVVDKQAQRPPMKLHRPFDQETSQVKWITKIIPWFDTIIGVLLILGLFSRLASGAAAIFLASVIATQPPLVPGAAPTYFYFIELAACLVIFATIAGRFGGLDYFLHSWRHAPKNSNAAADPSQR